MSGRFSCDARHISLARVLHTRLFMDCEGRTFAVGGKTAHDRLAHALARQDRLPTAASAMKSKVSRWLRCLSSSLPREPNKCGVRGYLIAGSKRSAEYPILGRPILQRALTDGNRRLMQVDADRTSSVRELIAIGRGMLASVPMCGGARSRNAWAIAVYRPALVARMRIWVPEPPPLGLESSAGCTTCQVIGPADSCYLRSTAAAGGKRW